MELKKTRAALENILTYKAEGALRFSKQRYYEMGNRASTLLAFLLHKAQANHLVFKVVHGFRMNPNIKGVKYESQQVTQLLLNLP